MKTLNREETKTFFGELKEFHQAAFDGSFFSHPVKGERISKQEIQDAVRNELGKGKVVVNTTDFWFIENTGEFFIWKGVATHFVNETHMGLFGFELVTAYSVVRSIEVFGLDLSEPPKPKELPAPKPIETVKIQDDPIKADKPKKVEVTGEVGDLDLVGLIETVMAKIKPEQLEKLTEMIQLFAGLMKPEPETVSVTVEEPVSFTDRPPVINLGSDLDTEQSVNSIDNSKPKNTLYPYIQLLTPTSEVKLGMTDYSLIEEEPEKPKTKRSKETCPEKGC